MNKEQIFGITRHLLTTIGGIIVASGYMTDAMVTGITGSIIALVGVIWSVVSKTPVEVK
jgi:hypothetical protein